MLSDIGGRHVEPDDFIEALESDFGRELDAESTLFFRHHPISVNLAHQILTGRLKSDGSDRDALVIQGFTLDMQGYAPGLHPTTVKRESALADLVETFARTFPDAGNVIGQALAVFVKGSDG